MTRVTSVGNKPGGERRLTLDLQFLGTAELKLAFNLY